LEYFKDVPGYEGLYKVSNCGRVYSVRRQKLFSPSRSTDGYLRVIFRVNKIEKSRTVHSLVMEAFRGARPPNAVINHLNFKRDDNNLANLEYTSINGNHHYSYVRGRYEKKSASCDDRFSPEQIRYIRDSEKTDSELSLELKTAKSFINKIRRRKNYAWVA
jgi:hypothetical protein